MRFFVWERENSLIYARICCAKPVQRLADHAKRFVPRTDASNCRLGFAMTQEHDGKDYPGACGIKKLTSTERYLGKGLPIAIKWGFSQF